MVQWWSLSPSVTEMRVFVVSLFHAQEALFSLPHMIVYIDE